jgi:hypothetical protein
MKYTNIFHCKTIKNLPKIGIFGMENLFVFKTRSATTHCAVNFYSAKVVKIYNLIMDIFSEKWRFLLKSKLNYGKCR